MGKIGIFAGTFDPVHNGHIAFALESARQAHLEKVIFLPERCPRNKSKVTAFADRVAMLKLAIKKHELLELVELEEEQFSVVNTLPQLHRRFGHNLSLIIGSDVAKYINRWTDIKKLTEQTEIIIALRQGDSQTNVDKTMASIGTTRFLCLVSPHKQTSSSTVRLGDLKKHVDPSVQAYILSAKGLYPLAHGAN